MAPPPEDGGHGNTADKTHFGRPFVVTQSGDCFVGGKVELGPGKHQVWLESNHKGHQFSGRDTRLPNGGQLFVPIPKTQILTVYNTEQALSFEEAPTLTPTSKMHVQEVTLTKARFRSVPGCGPGTGSREPSFYLNVGEAQEDFTLTALEGAQLQTLGPLEGNRKCSRGREVSFVGEDNKSVGTYGVWVSGQSEAEEGVVNVAVGNADAADSLLQLASVPANSTLQERELRRYFPFHATYPHRGFKRMAIEALFEVAPKNLFVFAERASNGMVANSPMLLLEHDDEWSHIVSLDGVRRKVRTSNLSLSLSAPVAIPATLAPPKRPEDIKDAAKIASPSGLPALASYQEKYDKNHTCVVTWMEKNDPSWRKGYELVYEDGRNVGDVKYKIAKKKCGQKLLDSQERTTLETVYKLRIATQERSLVRLRSLFK